ncbi:pilus assembly FimT family protein [Sulfurospirillum arcachonense]|uniref:pilus assembly FimT family protein n=1 Tax=Sulfurospirillum arcachonense TaxID=57666 RepID=UPI0004689367|nr:type II secretion system protein [Sulfurospirillum arcachonense]
MKKAFTMLELVFVIIIVGILSVVIIPNFDKNNLREAAEQVISHIRYTQHLAMMDNKFVPSEEMSNMPIGSTTACTVRGANSKKKCNVKFWYLGRWQIKFSNQWYVIMSDSSNSSYDGNPNASSIHVEVAKDFINTNKYLIGHNSSSFFSGTKEERINENLNLKNKYGVNKILISGGTNSNASRIIFDSLGRPYRGDTKLSNVSYMKSPTDKLATTKINIALCNKDDCSDKNITIVIEPETGYTHIL